jgi:hypothetical protein
MVVAHVPNQVEETRQCRSGRICRAVCKAVGLPSLDSPRHAPLIALK